MKNISIGPFRGTLAKYKEFEKYEQSFLEFVTSDYEHPQAEKSPPTNQGMDQFGAPLLTLACQTETDPATLYR